MVRVLLAISLIALAGCSTTAGERPAPLTSWHEMDVTSSLDVAPPLLLPATVTPAVGTIEGQAVVYYTVEQAERLESRLVALKANSDIAFEAVPAVDHLDKTVRALIEAGRLTETRANWLEEREHEAREDAYREKRDHMLDNFLYRILFVVLFAIGL